MASMTDVIFLLLIFFMVTSTVVFPNAIKVNLPQSSQQAAAKPLSRVTIDANLNYYVAFGNEHEQPTDIDQLVDFLLRTREREPEMFVACTFARVREPIISPPTLMVSTLRTSMRTEA